jgi:hypothetical protein
MFYAYGDISFWFINWQIKLSFIYASAQIWLGPNGWYCLKLLAMYLAFFEISKCKIFVWVVSEFHSHHQHTFYSYFFQNCV